VLQYHIGIGQINKRIKVSLQTKEAEIFGLEWDLKLGIVLVLVIPLLILYIEELAFGVRL